MKCPVMAQIVGVLARPVVPKPKLEVKDYMRGDRHPPGYMAAYARKRRARGMMFVELGL